MNKFERMVFFSIGILLGVFWTGVIAIFNSLVGINWGAMF